MFNLNPNKLIPETPIINNINNGILSSRGAMPLKGISSDNTNSFVKGRTTYSRTHEEKPTTETGFLHANKKKFFGSSNRDASQIAKNRRVNNIANGTQNASEKKMSFTNGNETNTVRTALHRTRSGGARVPAKVFNKYIVTSSDCNGNSVIPPSTKTTFYN